MKLVQRCQVERLDLLFLLILRVISLLHFPLYVDQFEHEQLVQEQPPVELLFWGSNEHCLFPFSINEEGGVRSSLASEARLSFRIHPTRFWLTIAFYSNYSLVFLVTVARPDERENYFPFLDRPRVEVGTILYFLVGSFFIIYSKFFSSIRFISFRKNRSCGNARF